ncbi:hypothetical protein ACFVX6_40185 [Streptomyces sp. NPDC058289]|uniref:hypothetical protein n=1 Tax=Streptomyces sp. NPDC058289 TaxID=3346425 RepID=UPI0036E4024F
MARTFRKQRFAIFAGSAAFVGGAALLPTGASATPAMPHTGEVTVTATAHAGRAMGDHKNEADEDHRGSKSPKEGKKTSKPRDVENMPGWKFYQGKVYCEHKPDEPTPAPTPAPPKPPAPAPVPGPSRENPGPVPNPAPNPAPAPPDRSPL